MGYPDSSRITVLVDKNPKRVGSACWYIFEYYWKCKTVGEFRRMVTGGRYRPKSTGENLSWDVGHRFIRISPNRSDSAL
jgi:hypothetical protein